MLLVVVFTFFYRDSEIVALEIHLADCQRALGSRWGMQDTSYRQNLLDFRKESRRPEWKKIKKLLTGTVHQSRKEFRPTYSFQRRKLGHLFAFCSKIK